ncbi:ribosomal RNA small subunit methyltransferase I [Virgisporangium aurantiacum]|uniref:Ribosomal RNA small subunit methyltransferase I n=2 Tax=Virgisporangium aurantiacum TaxID=175570 RepID=A0A8J3Z1H4_9ACTN|nr:ribosomal RNA small subunit methyltransferase I [Virgisporangium aurantiacum]
MPLIMLGAPLGNPGDASTRLRAALQEADVIAAEDTRRLARLAADLGISITAKTVSYFEGNEERRTPELVAALRRGETVAVITDGGMPSVSDPGFRLVRAALAEGVALTSVPGPSAVTTALALSGLPCDRFCFEGFPPRKSGERRAYLDDLADERRTLVFFESPHRIADTLADLIAAFGDDRPAALARELTKTHEEVRRAPLGDLAASVATDPPRGEITLVVGGAVPGAVVVQGAGDLAAAVAALEATGTPRKAAISAVAKAHGRPKRDVYAAVVASR